MLVNGWIQVNPGIYFYFDENGECVSDGWKKINNVWYYFKDSVMINQDTIIDGQLYRFSSNGACDGVGITVTPGWNLIAGQYYYVKDNMIVKDTSMTIDNNRYFFESDGTMRYATIVSENGKQYWLDKNGMVITNRWCSNNRHAYAYAGSDGALYTGKQVIDGKTYLFDNYGILQTGNVLSKDRKTLSILDKNGVITGTLTAQDNGWLTTPDGEWYYVKDGVFATNEILQINGNTYYFYSSGLMMRNDYMHSVGYADSNGAILTDGWCNGMYFEDGVAIFHTTRRIDGKYYLFRESRSVEGLEYMDGEYYYFDGKGNRISQNLKNGWNKVGNDWYYLENGNKYLYGDSCVKIGNEFYYFDYLGKMITNNIGYVYFSDERKIYFGANGTVEKNCWKTLDGFTYYFDANGCAVTGKQLIDGEWYIFDQEGVLL